MQDSTIDTPVALWRSPIAIILAGCLISLVGFGVRSSFGLFLDPITHAHGWDRQTFGLALAIQNLLWGAGTILASAIADRFGPTRVLALGALLYGGGVWGMAVSDTQLAFHLTAGVVVGLGVALPATASPWRRSPRRRGRAGAPSRSALEPPRDPWVKCSSHRWRSR